MNVCNLYILNKATRFSNVIGHNCNILCFASLGATWNMYNVLVIYAQRIGCCALESVDMEIKHVDN